MYYHTGFLFGASMEYFIVGYFIVNYKYTRARACLYPITSTPGLFEFLKGR